MLSEHDHRALGDRLDLFHLQEEAPGMVFWHPRGFILYQLLEERVRRELASGGYREVRTPQVLGQRIWESSGHWQNFRHGMFVLDNGERPFAMKPVSCPGHIQLFQRLAPSFRALPLRMAEFGLVHRNESSGALHGLFRLRQFTQDDGHIFCMEHQVASEVAAFCRSLRAFYREFGFEEAQVAFSSRPAQRAGDDALWDRAEAALLEAAGRVGLDCRMQPGEGAFYGPKLEFILKDRSGREWQCGTIQLDFVLPERFDLHYVDSGGEKRRPAMLHRAIFGSVERFLGILLEHHQGVLPAWLAPEQVRVLPVGADSHAYAAEVQEHLSAAGLRVEADARGETLSRRILEAHQDAVPFTVLVGAREQAGRSIQIRERGGVQRNAPLESAAAELASACRAA
ncbi:threonine--tRNA ligase [Stigmatella sp. ncwal1]|uniref:Threonine--tRNA ligase n=1 Tax=Stigmatella ashevillensis TaxID=2995309 RepID=A0ABT5D8M4_9BACT|nr:threonine--tRNA ligase [Stigmatella ashevillena]MDC0710018.1 threonine--tRNA ligase [Stigmatella ashevillena]